MSVSISKQQLTDLSRQIDELLKPVPKWLSTVRRPEFPYGRYRYYPSSSRPWCMYATVSGLIIEHRLGLSDAWTASQRAEALGGLLDCQNAEDGYFHCPVCRVDDSDPRKRCSEDNAAGMTKKAVAALHALGAELKHPLPLDENAIPRPVDGWLEKTFEENDPYSAGSIVGHLLGVRNQALMARGRKPTEDSVVHSVLEWLAAHQNSETGLFLARGDVLNGMNGLLKMRYGVFELTGTPIPRPKKVVQMLLALQRADGRFGPSCADFNSVSLLGDLGRGTPEYHPAIVAAYERVLPAFRTKQRPDGGFCFEPEDTDEPELGAIGVQVGGLMDMKAFLNWMVQRT